jgi:murein DD-endopeptidase MepM/ murein hydrolase activator NlpD
MHRLISLFIIAVIIFTSCSVSKDPQRKMIRQLQRGKITEDTSYVYALPYPKGKSHRVIQGYFSNFSHKNRAALDFTMKQGSKISAARDGVVIRLQESNTKGGWNKKYRQFANLVVVQHNDGTRAGYWHLQKDGVLVNVGDTVKQGQVIALSGKTGYSATPHLHFMVWKSTGSGWRQIPTRFQTKKGAKYLSPLRKYRNVSF